MGSLIWEESLGAFLLVTIAIGGGSAWMTGRATALTWDTTVKLVIYVLLLACATRFIHFALFQGSLFTLHYFVVDLLWLLAVALVARQVTRSGQMASQYGFEFRRSSPMGWTRRN